MRSLFYDIHRTVENTAGRTGMKVKQILKALRISRSWYCS